MAFHRNYTELKAMVRTLIRIVRINVVSFYFRHLPKIYQAFLMSATLSDDVKALKSLVLHNPVSYCFKYMYLKDKNGLGSFSRLIKITD